MVASLKALVILSWLICIASPVAIEALTMTYGATEWREDDQPVHWAAYAIDYIFLVDLLFTALLILVSPKRKAAVAAVVIPLLCLTGVFAFWGGLWVSGQWL